MHARSREFRRAGAAARREALRSTQGQEDGPFGHRRQSGYYTETPQTPGHYSPERICQSECDCHSSQTRMHTRVQSRDALQTPILQIYRFFPSPLYLLSTWECPLELRATCDGVALVSPTLHSDAHTTQLSGGGEGCTRVHSACVPLRPHIVRYPVAPGSAS